jgi:hypothetical protein
MKRFKTGLILAGMAALALVFVIGFTGCDTGTGGVNFQDPGGNDTGGNYPGGGGNGNGNGNGATGTKPNSTAAETLKTLLNSQAGLEVATVNDATVTVTKYLTVVAGMQASYVRGPGRAAGDPGEAISVQSITIPNGVTFTVGAGAAVTVAQGGKITVNAGDSTYKPAEIVIAQAVTGGSPKAAGEIVVEGAIDASGPIKLETGAKLAVTETATVEVKASAKIEVPAKAEVKVEGTLKLSNSATVVVGKTDSEAGTVVVSGTLELAAATAKVDLQGGTLEVASTGKVDNKGTISGTTGSTVDIKAGGTLELTGNGKAELKTVETKTEDDNAITASGSGAKVELPENSTVTVVAKEGATVTKGTETVSLTLAGTAVSYGVDDNALSVTFTFSKEVTAAASENSSSTWTVSPASDGTASKTVTATYSGSAVPAKLGVKVTAADTGTLTVTDANYYPVETAAFTRTAGTYNVVYYGEVAGSGTTTYAIAGLKKDNTTKYYLVTDTDFKKLFKAIYTPNAPNTTDSIEAGKSTVAYTDTISTAALALFNVTLDGSDSSQDKVEITGTLPSDDNANVTNLIVIDIGLPGTEDNSDLPTFYIPLDNSGEGSKKGTLGDGSTSYGGIRLRVNKGAHLVVLADNKNGFGTSCPVGGFKDGTVEVMTGGKLRDGAYMGFPLGSDAVILNRAGSYLAVGPESEFSGDGWFSGWLVGPAGDSPRIQWDNNQGYLEVRQGRLAISTNVTLKRTLGLIYSVWFVGGPTLTLDVPANEKLTISGTNDLKGLFAQGESFKFYGTVSPATKIIIKPGNSIHKQLLNAGATDATNFITNSGSSNIEITAGDTGDDVIYTGTIKGKLSWDIPE